MTDRYKALLEDRVRAKAELEVSVVWIAWKAADAGLRPFAQVDDDLDRLSTPLPILLPEEVVALTDGFDSWDQQDPLLLQYLLVRRAEELREQLINSAEWQSFQATHQRLLLFAKEELMKKKEALASRRLTSSGLSFHPPEATSRPSFHPSPLLCPSIAAPESAAHSSSLALAHAFPSTLHTAAHAATLLSSSPRVHQPSETATTSDSASSLVTSKGIDLSAIADAPSTSMNVDSADARHDSTASSSPQPGHHSSLAPTAADLVDRGSLVVGHSLEAASTDSGSHQAGTFSTTALEVSLSSAMASVCESNGASSSVVVTSEVSTTPTTMDHATSRTTRSRRSSPETASPQEQPSRSLTSSRLKWPGWCLGIIENGDQVLDANYLGLVDQEVREMCGSFRPQVQRIWSARGPRCLLAALVTAQRFNPLNWSHPTDQQMDELRQVVFDVVERWSDQQFADVITSHTKAEYLTKVLSATSQEQLDISFLRLFQSVAPAAPRVYVISLNTHAGSTQVSLDIIGNHIGSTTTTPCIVLYRHIAFDGHVEAVGWKPSRGATPLTTSFTSSHDLIVSLEKWKNQISDSDSWSPSPKRRRTMGEVIDLVLEEQTNEGTSRKLTHGTPTQELTDERPPHELGNGTPPS